MTEGNMDNIKKSEEIALASEMLSDYEYDNKSVYYGALKMAECKDKFYISLINELVDKLQTSRMYHLGITGIDSDAEILEKERKGNTSLIRGIDSTIKHVKDSIKQIKI